MSAVGRPGGFAKVGRGRYATRPGSGRWVIANHLLVEKAQTRAQMLHQWDQRPCTDARQIGRVRAGSDRRLGEIGRRDPNRPRPSVRQRDNDVGGTAPRPLLQHLKPVPKQKMMRVVDRDVRHDPVKNSGTLSCSASPLSGMRYWTALSTTPTGSNSTVRPCARSRSPKESRRRRSPRHQPQPMANRRREPRNDAQIRHPGRPRGSTGTSRARCCVSCGGTPQRARVPPVDYGDGQQRA